jgi:hypothetical protein
MLEQFSEVFDFLLLQNAAFVCITVNKQFFHFFLELHVIHLNQANWAFSLSSLLGHTLVAKNDRNLRFELTDAICS